MTAEPLRPPPLPDECPVVGYTIGVTRHGDRLEVRAVLIHEMPDGAWKMGLGSWTTPDELVAYVSEPHWLRRLFGDTIERRVARATRSVSWHAERRIARERRMESALEALS